MTFEVVLTRVAAKQMVSCWRLGGVTTAAILCEEWLVLHPLYPRRDFALLDRTALGTVPAVFSGLVARHTLSSNRLWPLAPLATTPDEIHLQNVQ